MRVMALEEVWVKVGVELGMCGGREVCGLGMKVLVTEEGEVKVVVV